MKTVILKALSWCRWYLIVPIFYLIGCLRRRKQIVSVWPVGELNLGSRIVLFVHFDKYGKVRQQVLDYISDLRENGRSIVFVSNSRRLTDEATAALREICAAIIIRRNVGYDFGAWRDALEHLNLPRLETEEIILANDSVFGPLVPLGDTLRRLDFRKADVWGLTDSWQMGYHLQSFFLAFGPAALRSEAFADFWRRFRPVPYKKYVVRAYEVGVTKAVEKGGLRCAALWSYDSLIKRINQEELDKLILAEESEFVRVDPVFNTKKRQFLRMRDAIASRVALNPTSDLWRQLLLSGFPFIKRELLRENPTDVEDIGEWLDVMRDILLIDPEPIVTDLKLMLKGITP
jgi:hypothetical protein